VGIWGEGCVSLQVPKGQVFTFTNFGQLGHNVFKGPKWGMGRTPMFPLKTLKKEKELVLGDGPARKRGSNPNSIQKCMRGNRSRRARQLEVREWESQSNKG